MKKLKLLAPIIILLLLVGSAVAFTITQTPVEQKDETLEPLGTDTSEHITTLRPDETLFSSPTGWGAVPSQYLPWYWFSLINESSPANTSDYIYKTSGRYAYTGIGFQDLFDGENPPPNDNIEITKVIIIMYCKDDLLGFPASNSFVGIGLTDWGNILIGQTKFSWEYRSSQFNTKDGATITIDDVDSMSGYISCTLGDNVNFRIAQVYADVYWRYLDYPDIYIQGGHIQGGHIGGG